MSIQNNMELFPGLVESLESQLSDGPVAFAHPPEDLSAASALADAVRDVSGGEGGEYAYVVIGEEAPIGVWARNMGEYLVRHTDYDTVLVRGEFPASSATVSTMLSRNQIVAAHYDTFSTEDYPASVGVFVAEAEAATPAWLAVAMVLTVCLLVAIGATLWTALRGIQPSRLG